MQIEKLGMMLGLDPITIRERNLLREGDDLSVMSPLPPGIDFQPILETCAKAIGWQRHGQIWRKNGRCEQERSSNPSGVGLALGYKNVGYSFGGTDSATATIELHGREIPEEAVLYLGGADTGQGFNTVILQIAAEALGLPVERIRLVGADTKLSTMAGSNSASRLTMVGGNAVMGAAEAALEKWRDEERPACATYTYQAPATTDFDPETGECVPNYSWGPVGQAVEMRVDTETGEISIDRVVSVVDAGKVVNPTLATGQIDGGVAQGIGYALMENFICEKGIIKTRNLSTYLMPTVLDMPQEMETIFLEKPDPIGPYGIRGIGEASLLCIAPALSSALKEATGLWFDRLPLVPGAVLERLQTLK
jgi:CO/xanthine dehydrogenase Mo-binding subunit